ncbi:MAG: M28 family peptidase, partial [Pyrinomonadaceae bacterium]
MKRNLFALLLLTTLVFQPAAFAQTVQVKITPAERKIAENVTAKQLSDYLHFVASDEMEGRDTPSRGLDLTAKFIAMNLSRWGFKPAGDDGTFFQNIAVSTTKVNPAATTMTIDGKTLVWGTDYLATPSAASVPSAPVVFGGNGWAIKARNIDALKDAEVTGKIVVLYMENLPPGMNLQQLRALGRSGVDYVDPVSNARAKGAAGVILLPTQQTITNWDRSRTTREQGGAFGVDKLRPASAPFPVVVLSQAAANDLLAGTGNDLAAVVKAYPQGPPLSINLNKAAAVNVAATSVATKTQNVVAIWEGSDSVLKNEMVAIGAHYDHVGINPNAPGPDKIWNGADDDGSGTVAVLAIAEALAKAPARPKRSVLFVWHCGEEKGLWGSEYFNKFPTVDIKNVIAQLNIDMIGRSKKDGDTNPRNKDLTGPDGVYVIGSEMMSSTLGSITRGTNDAFLKLGYDYKYDDPK